ncbi:MAG: metal ABC transporter permease [Blastochloris sp.]|nr:metal ABC transporter permease [Blastochloris sp.]
MDFWNIDFMRNTFLSALLLGPACALLGVFVTLRGMAFFSDALAHSALTGVALSLLLQELLGWNIDPMLVVLLFSLGLATAMAYFFERTQLRPDTIISFSFTGSVALGYILISMLGQYRIIDGLLFGSIYSNSTPDLLKQLTLLVTITTFTLWQLRPYTLAVLQPDLAHIQNINTRHLNYIFSLLIAVTVSITLKMAGALLLSALIVTPAAAAKLLAPNFRFFLILAPLLGTGAATAGVLLSFRLDSPTGPTIVLTNVAILILCLLQASLRRRA